MIDPARLLGFAFANADFLFEVDGRGTIVFATGAASAFATGDVVGTPAARMFALSEATKFATLSHALAKGDRAGPFKLKLVGGAEASLSLFRLPQNGNQISCTLSRPNARPAVTTDAKTGLATRDAFLAAASQMAGANDAIAMVNLPGLPGMCATLGEDESGKLLGSIGAALAKMGAKAAGRLSPSSFGVIGDAAGGTAKLAAQMRNALAQSGAATLDVEEALVSLKGKDISDDQRDLVLRYVVDKFAGGQWTGDAHSDAAAQFGKMMDETHQRLRILNETVAEGSFSLAYQPIVSLKSGETAHFEALARFAGGETAQMIGFAEQLGVSDAFDLAVAVKVLALVESKASHGHHIAFNISGKTICTAADFGVLAGLLARKRALAPRLLIEITETVAITDMEAAVKAVAALREMGYRVGLDDFGAGAAQLNYLHALTVDFVKFDGSLVKKIGQSRRDDVLLAGLVKLCGELGVPTIAEYLERADQVAAAKAMGFDKGQGHYFGAAAPDLPVPEQKPAAKRRGVTESWG